MLNWANSISARSSSYRGGLVLVIILGMVLRFWGIGFGLPYTYAPDEPTRWAVALHIVQTGDLNPYWLGYPHLFFYLNAAALFIYFLVGRAASIFNSPADIPPPDIVSIGVGKLAMPSEFLVARGLTALFGTGAILLVYLIGCQISGRKSVGLLAALLFAVSPAAVSNSQLISLDTFGLFFLLLAFYWIYPIRKNPGLKQFALAGAGIGLAFSGKYNVVIVAVPFAAAYMIRYGISGIRRKEIYIAVLFSIVAFAAVNPFSVLDLGGFFYGLTLASGSQSQYAGSQQNGFLWYISYLWDAEGILLLVAAVQAARLLKSNWKNALVLLSFPVIYYVFVSRFAVSNDRTILPVIPFLDFLAAGLAIDLLKRVADRSTGPQPIVLLGSVLLYALLLFQPLRTTLAEDLRLTQIDGRETARQWIESSLPDQTRIAEEGYAPYLDPKRYVITATTEIVDHPAEWYPQNGFEYLVVSQGMYGRFFQDRTGYAEWVAKYEEFFRRFPEVKRFSENGYEVRILKTDAALPSRRIAARFGNTGQLVELVGYDINEDWTLDKPIQVKLYWRTLEQREPLELALRLTDQAGEPIAATRADLFQGAGWREGIVGTVWQVEVPTSTPPGLYNLQVNVIQTRYGYQAPVTNSSGEKLEELNLGPFKRKLLVLSPQERQALHSTDIQWTDGINLLGYAGPGRNIHPGDELTLAFYWQSSGKPLHDYTLFVHLLDASGKVRAQVDATPGRGNYPTSAWDAGEIIPDRYALQLPADIEPGNYSLQIGWYDRPTLARLTVTATGGSAEGDHWAIPEPVVVVK